MGSCVRSVSSATRIVMSRIGERILWSSNVFESPRHVGFIRGSSATGGTNASSRNCNCLSCNVGRLCVEGGGYQDTGYKRFGGFHGWRRSRTKGGGEAVRRREDGSHAHRESFAP